MTRRRQTLAVLTVLSVLASGSVVGATRTARAARKAKAGRPLFDKPDEAERFYAQKRLPDGVGATVLPVERYLAALDHMRDMPQHSTLLGKALPSRAVVQSAGLADSPDILGTWTWLGPGNIGGRTRSLVIHPTTPSIMYAAGVAGGVWKSTNSGGSWTPLTDLMANIAVSSLVMDPTNPTTLYAGTGEGFSNADAVRGLGIFKTTDAGATWASLPATANLSFARVNDLVMTSGTRLYAATRGSGVTSGIWRSTDSGTTWTQVFTTSVNGGVMDLAIRTDVGTDWVVAAVGNVTAGSILLNTDAAGAGTWNSVLSDAGMARSSLAVAPSDQTYVYALSAKEDASSSYHRGLHKVFRSTDGGATWATRLASVDPPTSPPALSTLLLSNPREAACFSSFLNQGWYDNVIAVDPVDRNRVWAGGVDLFRSDDGGATFGEAAHWDASTASARYAHADQHRIVFHPQYDGVSNQTMYVGNDGGLFRTDNAVSGAPATANSSPCSTSTGSVSWVNLNSNYGVTQFYHGVPYPDGTTYLAGAQDNGTNRGTDAAGPNAWSRVLGGDGGYVAVDSTNTNRIFGEFTNLSIVRSTNGGSSFSTVTSGITETSGNFLFITPFFMDTTTPSTLLIGGLTVWRTTNSATNWSAASAPLANQISALTTAPTDGNFALVGTTAGLVHRTTTLLSNTAATVWPSSTPRPATVSWLTFDPSDKTKAYVTYSSFNGASTGHVFKSTDSGATWAGIDGAGPTGLPDIPAHCIVVDPANGARLFVGTDLGVFTSTDGGANWAVENTGFANTVTESMSLVGTTLFAFTHGRGAYRVTVSPTPNTPPQITAQAGGVTVQRGGPSVAGAPVATVSDAETGAALLTVTQVAGGTATGITLSSIANTNGAITATVSASCAATAGTVRLQVTDAGTATATADLAVTVGANPAPVQGTYPASNVAPGGSITVTPSQAPSDNGSVATLTATAPTFTGTLAGNPATGVVSVTNAGPLGTHTVTVTATDDCGATSTRTFSLDVVNSAPQIVPQGGGITVQKGGPALTNATIATVTDNESGAGTLVVTQIAGGTATGVTVSSITNTAGTIKANVAASCTATSGTVRLQVTDPGNASTPGDLTVSVTANPAPTQGTYPTGSVAMGGATTVTPDASPTDNGSLATLTAAAPGFTGTLSASTSTGVVTVTNAGPIGAYTVTVTATDDCGATSTRTFTLQVTNSSPTITAGATVTRQQGSDATPAPLASVSDAETAAGSLTVTQIAGGSATGVTVTSIVNAGGAITGSIAASCTATSGTVRLQVADANGGTSTADLPITVTANSSPTLGSYPATSLSAGGGATITPGAPPGDNGPIASVTATAPGFTGTILANPTTGVLTVTNAGPVGQFNVTVSATDSCGLIGQASFTLTVVASNSAPTIAAGGPLTRVRGLAGSASTIATVGDAESSAGSLTVTVQSAPPGITVSGVGNAGGVVSATVSASCTAAAANLVVLQVSDGTLTSTASLTVDTTPNTVPPAVTAPAGVTVDQSTCVGGPGATLQTLQTRLPSQFAALTALVAGGTAVDDCTASPTRLAAQLSGQDITATTRFPVGTSSVQIRFADADGNLGTAQVAVVVRRQGDVDLDGDVDISDNLIVASFIVGNVTPGTAPFNASSSSVADADGNGTIDVFDIVLQQSFIVGNVACLTP